MNPRDVILTAYACSVQAPCGQWAREFFREEPLVLSVPGNGGTFLRKGRQWGATGDAFQAAVEELAPQDKELSIRRRALVTLGAGWQLGHHILQHEIEQQRLDAYIVEDGLYTEDLEPWINFATRAANGEAWMAMVHTQATIPVGTSAKEANEAIFDAAVERATAGAKTLIALPDYLDKPKLPPGGVKISVPPVRDFNGRIVMPAQTKVWEEDCLASWRCCGNLYIFEYEGVDRPDHAYIELYVAPRLWRLLGDNWS